MQTLRDFAVRGAHTYDDRCWYLPQCSGEVASWILIKYEDGSMFCGTVCQNCLARALDYLYELTQGGALPIYVAVRTQTRAAVTSATSPTATGGAQLQWALRPDAAEHQGAQLDE